MGMLVAQTSSAHNCEELRTEWNEQQDRYNRETFLLEERFAQWDEEYDRRWRATEVDEHRMMEERTKRLEDARAKFEAQFAEMDEALTSEKAISQAQAEKNKEVLYEERARLSIAMEAKLASTRAEMNERVEI